MSYNISMLRFVNQFTGSPIKSLRNGRTIGRLSDPILDPRDLSIAAFYVEVRALGGELVLFSDDIREYTSSGAIVDSEDNLMETDGLVRLEELQEINFSLVGKQVITDKKRKVGKVSDFTVDDASYQIEKLYVRPPMVKSISSGERIIGRRQIVEVNDSQIIVKDADIRSDQKSRSRKAAFNPLNG